MLRGRDADGRLRELAAARRAARPVLGALSAALLERTLYQKLGYRCTGDYAREHLGVGARTVREWARVWRRLEELPKLREAVARGEVGWAVARRVVGLVTPDTEEACLETVRGRTVRAVEAIVRAVQEAEARTPPPSDAAEAEEEPRLRVCIPCQPREWELWQAAVELARRWAGESLPTWRCAEAVAAEAAAAGGAPEPGGGPGPNCSSRPSHGSSPEHGLRSKAFPRFRWRSHWASLPGELSRLTGDLDCCAPREVDRRLRSVVAWLQRIDLQTGAILRQMVDRRLFGELGFDGLERYVQERLDCSPRTARRWVALSRAEHRVPAVASAFRRGQLHAFQAAAIARVADRASARAWVERARAVTFRRLEDETEAVRRSAIVFHAPKPVAALFLGMLQRAGSLARLLAHAIVTWMQQGSRFRDYADFGRDGFRCLVPGCTGRASLESHHRWYRSAQGPDVSWNRVTLCVSHHRHGVHAGNLRILGRAPDRLVFELGVDRGERFASGDVRLGSAIQPI